MWRYTEALGALREVVAKAGDDPSSTHRVSLQHRAGGRGGGATEDDPDVR